MQKGVLMDCGLYIELSPESVAYSFDTIAEAFRVHRHYIDHLLAVQGALTTECESLRKQIERLERAQPPKSWLSATVAAVRSHRIRCAA